MAIPALLALGGGAGTIAGGGAVASAAGAGAGAGAAAGGGGGILQSLLGMVGGGGKKPAPMTIEELIMYNSPNYGRGIQSYLDILRSMGFLS